MSFPGVTQWLVPGQDGGGGGGVGQEMEMKYSLRFCFQF